jgi:hypothetical protein
MTTLPTSILDDIDLSPESKIKIIDAVQKAANHQLAENIAGIVEAVQTELTAKIDTYLGECLSAFYDRIDEDYQTRLDESVNDLAAMIVSLADATDEKTRVRFYERVAKVAQQADRQSPSHYPGADRQDGSDVVGDETAEQNRQSCRPAAGTFFGTQRLGESIVDDNMALRDELIAREKARGERYHAALIEYLTQKEGRAQGNVLRG